ncbi:MAG: hypothetical protein PUC99_02535 [Eubacteriales bacterium]|nr:hypothetical protein [Eubacteriales bacterium]
MQKYMLMHKDNPCAAVVLDDETGNMLLYKTYDPAYVPFLGGCNQTKFAKWWKMRAVPASRDMMQQTLRDAGVLTAAEYLAKNLAVSVTDTYWLCPEGSRLTYADVNIHKIAAHGRGIVPYHNATSYDPNASLGGQMTKYWDLKEEVPVLVKESYKFFGQQALNEVLATKIHEMQQTAVPFVRYAAYRTEDGGIECRCRAFTNETLEFVPAYEVIESQHIRNSQNLYNAYIDIASAHGADRTEMQNFMDYQTLTDFLISNTDEHLLNFGLLRDTESMKIVGPAPIFDSGNSMFYSDERMRPYTRAELLERKITSFYQTEDKLLANVKNPHLLNLDLLPSVDLIREFYSRAGIPESRLNVLTHGYEDKMHMIAEMQRGIKISLYHEKQKEKSRKHRQTPNPIQTSSDLPQRFVMIAGIPGSGKRRYATEKLNEMQKIGYKLVSAESLYPAEQADQASLWFVDRNHILSSIQKGYRKHQNEIVYIDPNDIRNERKQKGLPKNDDLVFAAVYARIKQAAVNGQTIIYSEANLDKKQRELILKTVRPSKIDCELTVLYADPNQTETDISGDVMREMAERLHRSAPDKSEGWNRIKTIGDDPLLENRDIKTEKSNGSASLPENAHQT